MIRHSKEHLCPVLAPDLSRPKEVVVISVLLHCNTVPSFPFLPPHFSATCCGVGTAKLSAAYWFVTDLAEMVVDNKEARLLVVLAAMVRGSMADALLSSAMSF